MDNLDEKGSIQIREFLNKTQNCLDLELIIVPILSTFIGEYYDNKI
jgi:ABC-type multidrug transport system permease subunit